MTGPLVSIQIPTYNQHHLIARTIESALAQTYTNLEIVIADDSINDATKDVVQKYLQDKRVKYFKNDKNLGRVANYHKALYDYVTGEWVVNLDGDDYFTNTHFIADSMDLLQQFSDKNIVLIMNQNPHLRQYIHSKKNGNISYCFFNGLDFLTAYSDVPTFFHLASLFKREPAISNNKFYTDNTLNADFVSLLSLADKGNFLVTDMEAGYWNFNQDSATSRLSPDLRMECLFAIEKMVDSLNFNVKEKKTALRELLFVANYYYATSMRGGRLEKLKHLFEYKKLKGYYFKGIIKIILGL